TWLRVAAEAASPMGVAPKKMATGLVSTAMTVTESPFTLREGSAIVTSASTRAALVASTVIDDVFVGPSAGDALAYPRPSATHRMNCDACALTSMLLTKLVVAISACITHWLAPGTSWARPTAPMRFGVWSSENGIHPGAAFAGNDSLPALTGAPPAGL